MKISLLTILAIFLIKNFYLAQIVTIPDPNFVLALQFYVPNSMTGDQLDTNNPEVTTLDYMDISNGSISNISGIEHFTSLLTFFCSNNSISDISFIPSSIVQLDCSYNLITSLPLSLSNIVDLKCNNNQITTLPQFVAPLMALNCSYNQISYLPYIPGNSFSSLICNNNQITCFANFPINPYTEFIISPNPYFCLPRHIGGYMTPQELSTPLCENGANPFNCIQPGINGYVFHDINTDCLLDINDSIVKNIPVYLKDQNDIIINQTYTNDLGKYNFPPVIGIHTISLDTIITPISIQCVSPGIDTTINSLIWNSQFANINFGVKCKNGIDLGVQSVYKEGLAFPGQNFNIQVIAGDLSQWNGLNCANSVGGTVEITINGPISFTGTNPGALIPNINGNTYTYSISDFGIINIESSFGLSFLTNSSAQSNDSICIYVTIDPLGTDSNPIDNQYSFCYPISNSLDPNYKETYPSLIEPFYDDFFTYTIHFQNIGTAPAMNIFLTDELSSNLDLNTFQVINFSHYNSVLFENNLLTVKFPNINLIDSISDPLASQGFVQYRIKPFPNMPNGTFIENTAYIYFDFNSPVVTNTTINEFTNELTIFDFDNTNNIKIYPNPSSNLFTIQFNDEEYQKHSIKIINLLGKTVYSKANILGFKQEINIEEFENGIYFIEVESMNSKKAVKVVVQK